MLCDVYLLRDKGLKLPKDQLRGLRGHVHLQGCVIAGDATRPGPYRSYTAYLTDGRPPPYPGACQLQLDGATMTRLDGRGFVLTGEELGSYHEHYPRYPQAWFCKPVTDGA